MGVHAAVSLMHKMFWRIMNLFIKAFMQKFPFKSNKIKMIDCTQYALWPMLLMKYMSA